MQDDLEKIKKAGIKVRRAQRCSGERGHWLGLEGSGESQSQRQGRARPRRVNCLEGHRGPVSGDEESVECWAERRREQTGGQEGLGL